MISALVLLLTGPSAHQEGQSAPANATQESSNAQTGASTRSVDRVLGKGQIPSHVIHRSTEEMVVPVTVKDSRGVLVRDLRRDEFRV